ncbi:Putative regulatory protein clustered with metal efflux genes, P-II family [hydrothermal vent metagenome]|uniref:Regulatory protein clustered with metal efflux genes, P-II family n=1 Tax=hydrothermal vent metagenome TaxID=652676 RepID=A0A3B1CM90_9ZZZZ
MKEVKAFIHRNRVADVLHALKSAGFKRLSISHVEGMLNALDHLEQDYSVALGEAIIKEIKLELVCEDDRVDQAIQLIQKHAKTGQSDAGWIYVLDIVQSLRVEGSTD